MDVEGNTKKMRVLLINPSFDRSKQYGHLNRLVKPGLPLSIGALAGYLLDKGVSVRVADDQVDDLSAEGLTNILNDFSPSIAGMTCLTPNVFRVFELASIVKAYCKDIWVVAGGAHATVCPDECLGNGNIDFVARQEGEVTLWELVKARLNQTGKEYISGLSFKENGKIRHNPDRPFQQRLDEFPKFPFKLLMNPPGRYNPGHLVTSRGCPFKCVFCSSRNISGFGYRSLSAGRVIEEIEGLINDYKIRSLMFEDDNFLVDKKRAMQICDGLIEKGFNRVISWRCQARADLVSLDVLGKMKQAGCVNISFGIETASQRLMELIKKGETVEDNIKAVRLAKSAGLGTRGAFILGLPTETRQESLATIRLAKSLPLDEVKFSLATPYPGSPLYEMAKKEGCIIDGRWERLNTTVGL
ncbi:radical SAM protein, partial [bacterium]